MFLETVYTLKNMFQGPALRAPDSNQSVRPSIRPRSHLLSPWPNITHTSPTWGLWIKGVRRLLTHFLGLKLRSWHNYRKKIHVRITYSLSLVQSGSQFTHRVPLVKENAVILNEFSRSRSYQTTQKKNSEHIYSPHYPIWLIRNINRALG